MSDKHLDVTTSDRGFDRLPAIPSSYGGSVRVYESSNAEEPSIWVTSVAPANLNDPDGPTVEAPLHLHIDNAWRLAQQLVLLVHNHYQGAPSPVRLVEQWGIRVDEEHPRRNEKVGDIMTHFVDRELVQRCRKYWHGWTPVKRTVMESAWEPMDVLGGDTHE